MNIGFDKPRVFQIFQSLLDILGSLIEFASEQVWVSQATTRIICIEDQPDQNQADGVIAQLHKLAVIKQISWKASFCRHVSLLPRSSSVTDRGKSGSCMSEYGERFILMLLPCFPSDH